MGRETPDTQTIISCDMMGKINAANFATRRNLEDVRSTEGQYEGHRVVLARSSQSESSTFRRTIDKSLQTKK